MGMTVNGQRGYPRQKQDKPDATYTIYVCANCYCDDTDPHKHCWGCGIGNGWSGHERIELIVRPVKELVA